MEFDIYRNSTFTDTIISSDSFHSQNKNTAAINFIIHRMVNITLSRGNRRIEFQTIKQIAFITRCSDEIEERIITKNNSKRKKIRLNYNKTKFRVII